MDHYTSETEKAYQREKSSKLMLSIVFDIVGMLTYAAPGVAEMGDLAWAPIAAVANFIMFRGTMGVAGAVGTFAEELIPGTDLIPSFTITWAMKYVVREKETMAEFAAKHRERKTLLAD